MQPTLPKTQTIEENLKERLKKRTSPSWRMYLPLSVLLLVIPLGIEMALSDRGHHLIESGKAELLALLCAGLLTQAFVLLWFMLMRFFKPETTPRGGWYCFWLNILVVLIWPVVVLKAFPMLPMPAGILPACFLLFMWIYFILEATQVNRLILALRRPNKEKAAQMASPCPTYFEHWDFIKSIVFLPLVAMVVVGLVAGIFCGVMEHFSMQNMWHSLQIGAFFGAATVPLSLFALPYCFLEQTRTPYAFQRIIRAWSADMNFARLHAPEEEKAAFFWWLSHPGEPWPDNFKEITPYIDVAAFNWQDPDAWAGPVERANQMYQKDLLKSSSPLPTLTIGEQAQEVTNNLTAEPVTQITPLFKAILQNDLATLQQLLPQYPLDLNRPFLATGNTLLHVAVLNGYTEIARLLLAQPDIDTARRNNDGKTALELAQEKGFTEIVNLLK